MRSRCQCKDTRCQGWLPLYNVVAGSGRGARGYNVCSTLNTSRPDCDSYHQPPAPLPPLPPLIIRRLPSSFSLSVPPE
eukprot:756717-Hanusia_phi.AAC.2